jgi:hypothetical protein
MDIARIINSAVVRQTVAQIHALGRMTRFTILGRTRTLTGRNNRLGWLVSNGAPGAREVTAVTVGYCISCHMLIKLSLGICHIRMTGGTVITA